MTKKNTELHKIYNYLSEIMNFYLDKSQSKSKLP
jgi:hypothetical protein